MKPSFKFDVPRGYDWLIQRSLVSFEGGGPLQPWHFLPEGKTFSLRERWPSVKGPNLVAFARRQDCDDLACFEVSGNKAVRVALVHGWTPEGYAVTKSYPNFWEWFRSTIDDIAEWAEMDDVE